MSNFLSIEDRIVKEVELAIEKVFNAENKEVKFFVKKTGKNQHITGAYAIDWKTKETVLTVEFNFTATLASIKLIKPEINPLKESINSVDFKNVVIEYYNFKKVNSLPEVIQSLV